MDVDTGSDTDSDTGENTGEDEDSGGKARARICDKNTKNTEDEETRIGIRRDEETKN